MNGAGSKAKGGAFEREVCKRCSLWLSGGARDDLFWRSAMSGGRATLQLRKDVINQTQGGDISAISEDGWKLINRYFVEAKFYADLNLEQAIFKGTGNLNTFWARAIAEAVKYRKFPILIAKQNRFPVLAIVRQSDPLFGMHTPLMFSKLMDAKIFDFETVVNRGAPSILNSEVWRPLVGYEDHLISSLGRIQYMDKIIDPYDSDPRYIAVRPAPGSRVSVESVAKLMLLSFVGLPPEGKNLACHLDDDVTNNSIWNVGWGSHYDNAVDRHLNGKISSLLTVKGTMWINNGLTHKMIPKGSPIPEGWERGRGRIIFSEPTKLMRRR